MAEAVLALDQGTTSSRAVVYSGDGSVLSVAQREFPQHFPQPGWVEHDPEDIWQSQIDAAREALAAARLGASQLGGIGIANQRETTVVWERRTGRPVCRAVVWQDRRTAGICAALRSDGCSRRVREITGLEIDPYFSGVKLRWLMDQNPELARRAACGELAFGTVDSWLIHRLTGGRRHVTDVSNASRTLLLDLADLTWSQPMLDLLGIPREALPEICPSSGLIDETDPGIFGGSAPIRGVAGDQQAALFGQNCVLPGRAKCTYGTGCFLLANTGAAPVASRRRLLSTVAWSIGPSRAYALEGSVFMGGAAVQWLRDGLGIIAGSSEVERLAGSVPDTGGVAVVPAFTGLGAPHWDPDARGAILGLTRGSTSAHIARATLEGIAHQVADVVDAMADDRGSPLDEIRVDGGAAANDLLMQMQADLTRLPVVRPADLETTARGAAMLAGLPAPEGPGAGARVFEPALPGRATEAARERWRAAVGRVGGLPMIPG
ncbi:MAG: glycerol kinase GlpK [Armatimonadetes bacterium]|nr:glycerol kinase GlpK [Armatimonadota bacterium]